MTEKAMAIIDSAIEALEANSTSAPVVELLKAAKAALPPLRAREEIARIVGDELGTPFDELPAGPHFDDPGYCQEDFLRCADTILSRTTGQEWQDISSAPKDSRFIDLWHKKQGRRLADCRWLKDDLPNKVGAWFAQSGGRAFNMGLDDEFSHWMPLPAPPVTEPIVAEKQTER